MPSSYNPPVSGASVESQKVGVLSTSIASASTINLALATGQIVHITGNATINSLGNCSAGLFRQLLIDGNPTFIDSSNLQLPDSTDWTPNPGDTLSVISSATNVWQFIASLVSASVPSARLATGTTQGLNDFFSADGGGSGYGLTTGFSFFDTFTILTDGSGGMTMVNLTVGNTVTILGMPTSDPHVVGQLWSNLGIVTISNG